jgi:antitoxin Phd
VIVGWCSCGRGLFLSGRVAVVGFAATAYPPVWIVARSFSKTFPHLLAEMYIRMYILRMPKRYSIAEARSNLPTIVDQVEAGQEIELTRRGKPVAVVVSLREFEKLRGGRVAFGEAYRRFLKTHPLREVGVEADFFDSARTAETGRKVKL